MTIALLSNQLQVVTIGLQGSGKSTTASALAYLLGGQWLNQDEFAHHGKNAKAHMMNAIREVSQPDSPSPVLIVDRINTLRSHRKDVFGHFGSNGVRVVIVWESDENLCVTRIKSRGYGHRTIGPDSNVSMIIGRTAKEYETLSTAEIDTYGIVKVISILTSEGLSREQVLSHIVTELRSLPKLIHLSLDAISETDITKAIEFTAKREHEIMAENEKKLRRVIKPIKDTLIREGRYELVIERGCNFLKALVSIDKFQGLPLVVKEHFHVTLLFVNKRITDLLNDLPAGNLKVSTDRYSKTDYARAIKEYRQLAHTRILVRPKYVVRNDRVMAVRVEFMHDYENLMHFDVTPHISIAKIPDALFRESNYLVEKCDTLQQQNITDTDGIVWAEVTSDVVLSGTIQFKLHGQH